MRTGVPQGSVIGPLLYAIFTNETSEVVKKADCTNPVHLDKSKLFGQQCTDCGVLVTYADDTTYAVNSRHRGCNQQSLIRTLGKMTEYLNENRLAINPPKTSITEFMLQQKKGKTPVEPPKLVVEGKVPGTLKN